MLTGLRSSRDGRGQPIDLGSVEPLLDRIVRKWNPVGIWLFGSRARGYAHPESDWDLLVLTPDGTPGVDDPLAGYEVTKDFATPADVLLCPVGEFEEAREVPNTLAYEAAHFGVLVYAR